MEPLSLGNDGNLAFNASGPLQGTVGARSPERFTPRVLELTGLLQTTLDLEQQIQTFAKAVGQDLALDGLSYRLPRRERQVKTGRQADHRASYDLTVEDESLGSVVAFRDVPFSAADLHALEHLLCALVYPLRNALRYLAAVELASRDPLTGTSNRLALDGALVREVELAHRQATPLSMLVLDIDHFKAFNDSYGHDFGDDVLVAIAQTVASTIRRCDLLYRYGGEEFVVLASHTGEGGAMLLAERIRENVAAVQTVRGRPVRLRISVGVASLLANEDGQGLFRRADAALYQAKEGGRNRCILAG